MKTIIITGAAGGIGSRLHAALSGAFSVAVCERRYDVENFSRVRGRFLDIAESVRKMRGEDVWGVIHCAGTFGEVGLLQPDRALPTLTTNILGTMNVLACAREIGARKVIAFAGGGVGGDRMLTHCMPYLASKGAMAVIVEAMSVEAPEMQINLVAPGSVPTKMTQGILDAGREQGEDLYDRIKAEREAGGSDFGKAEAMIRFLLSDESAHVTGRMLSAQWDALETLRGPLDARSYKMRRVVP